MDDIVRQAMAKWPNVPHCYGWLGLDARGDWYMRDDATQAAGPFPQAKGSRLQHDKLIAFIARNYAPDEQGRWFFQNGPQRVFVDLEDTPLIARIGPDLCVYTHTGQTWAPDRAWVDEAGLLYLADTSQVARVHTQDMMPALDWLDQRGLIPAEMKNAELPRRYRFVRHPALGTA
ncbi:MAG: DUF2946 family protein [Alphaproteobacteria bacterium]|nr:DUF2946 family protein [Alphaproteobacteria bacterium]